MEFIRARDLVPYSLYEKFRNEKGVTDYAVSQATGVATAAFSEWKKGRYAPKEDKLRAIAVFLGIPMESLYQFEGDK